MKYSCTVISVTDINSARRFYEDLFGLKVFQDYGKNIVFTCGLALQQDFDWLDRHNGNKIKRLCFRYER